MKQALEEIRAIHSRTTAGAKEGLAFRYVSRPAASAILWGIRHTRITPNQVTLSSFAVALVGVALLAAWASYWALVVSAFCFVLAHVLDALDGQLARYRKQGSELGHQLDFFIDELKAYAILVGIGLRHMQELRASAAAHEAGRDWLSGTWLLGPCADHGFSPLVLLLIGIAGLGIGLSCTRFFRLPAWSEGQEEASAAAPATRGAVAKIEAAGRFVVDYPSWLPLLMLAGKTEIYLVLYPAILALYALRSLAQICGRAWRWQPRPRSVPAEELHGGEEAKDAPAGQDEH